MELWLIWVLAAVLLAVGEVLTAGFFLAPFAAGALLAALAGVAGAGTALTVVVFLVASGALLTGVRPIARRHMRTPVEVRTGTAALVGRTAVVLERVAEGSGVVKLEGEVWTARPYDQEEVIEVGGRVEVLEIRGATALVTAS